MPEWWKNSIESGSPPCSPQIPSSMSFFVLRPSHAPCAAICPTPGPPPHAQHLPDPRLVERLERRAVEDLPVDVLREDLALDVVAAEPEPGLGQVVRAEREEVRVLGDPVRDEARARELDHRADLVVARVLEALALADV